MDASAILNRLHDLGITVEASGQKVRLQPGSKVPSDLLDEVRRHKAEIISELNRGNEINELSQTSRGDSRADLLVRLQEGQRWLLDQHQRWQVGDASAATDDEFSRVWNAWWELDDQLRTDYGFEGCVFGTGGACPEGFPCQGCAEMPAPAVVAQLALGE